MEQKLCELCSQPIKSKQAKRFCSVSCRNTFFSRRQKRLKGRTCIKCKRYGYGWTKDLCGKCQGRLWTPEEIKYLYAHYPSDGCEKVAQVLNKTPIQIRTKANRLHICLTKKATYQIVHSKAKEFMLTNNPMWKPEIANKVNQWYVKYPEKAVKRLENLLKGSQKLQKDKPNKLELKLQQFLMDFQIKFEAFALIKPKFIVDIRIGSLIIQADGDYWHGHPRFKPLTERQKAQQRRDQAQNKYLQACGYKVVRIWESDLTKDKVFSILKNHNLV